MNRLVSGVLATIVVGWTGMASATLITNGGFEINGGVATSDFTGWTASADGTVEVDSTFPYAGASDAVLSTIPGVLNGPGVLSQSIVTVPGQSYTLTFQLQDSSGLSGDEFDVKFGGFSSQIFGDQAPFYSPFSFTIAGSDVTDPVTTLEFDGATNDPSSGGAGVWNLDNVSLDPVAINIPEPPAALLFAGGLMVVAGFWQLSRRRAQ